MWYQPGSHDIEFELGECDNDDETIPDWENTMTALAKRFIEHGIRLCERYNQEIRPSRSSRECQMPTCPWLACRQHRLPEAMEILQKIKARYIPKLDELSLVFNDCILNICLFFNNYENYNFEDKTLDNIPEVNIWYNVYEEISHALYTEDADDIIWFTCDNCERGFDDGNEYVHHSRECWSYP